MSDIKMVLKSSRHDETEIMLSDKTENEQFDFPSGKEAVFNDDQYIFTLLGITDLPSKIYINDDAFEPKFCNIFPQGIIFKIMENEERPFYNCFGAIRLSFVLNGIDFYSQSLIVMVSNTDVNQSVMNMIQYIYDNSAEYLYEEREYTTGYKNDIKKDSISVESEIKYLQNALLVYKQSYQYLRTNPYSKLKRTEKIDSFDKLQVVTPKTIQYITNNTDELTSVNYDTGVRYNGQYFQPNRILVERNEYSYDVYENHIIIGFIKTLVYEISKAIKKLSNKTYHKSKSYVVEGYIDSMYQIFSKSIQRINYYIKELKRLQNDYQQLYYFYSKLFSINADSVHALPAFTPIFRSINAYHQVYTEIHKWFSVEDHEICKDDFLLSFISTSKIYEYYCLVKILNHIDKNTSIKFSSAKRAIYYSTGKYYTDTKYNNTFTFENEKTKLTLYFQPVVYDNDKGFNGIKLFRNTTSSSKKENEYGGHKYTPDYIIKAEYQNNKTAYIILDAKFTSTNNIRRYELNELVYKYLFSISTLNNNDHILGLYIICGKSYGTDSADIVHDVARRINHYVTPFAEILTINGHNTSDVYTPNTILTTLTNHSMDNT